MSRTSSPSFAVGGVPYLDAFGEASSIYDPLPCGWRCFHCNAHFTHWRAARRHFGDPGSDKKPECIE